MKPCPQGPRTTSCCMFASMARQHIQTVWYFHTDRRCALTASILIGWALWCDWADARSPSASRAYLRRDWSCHYLWHSDTILTVVLQHRHSFLALFLSDSRKIEEKVWCFLHCSWVNKGEMNRKGKERFIENNDSASEMCWHSACIDGIKHRHFLSYLQTEVLSTFKALSIMNP